MRKPSRLALPVLLCLLGLALFACSPKPAPMTPEELATKHFLGADYALMHPAPGAEGRMVWRKPGLDPKEYTSVLLDPTVVWQMEALAKDSGASPEELTALAKYFDDVLRKTLTSIEFPLTDVAKPRAMRISAAIVQVKTSRPALNTISSVLPVGIVMTLGRKAVGASDPSVGACTIELRFSDATTGETLGLFADHKVGDKYDTANFSKLGQTEKAMDQWAEMLRQGILKNWGARQQ